MSELLGLLERIRVGAKVAGHQAEDDYQRYVEELIKGDRGVADHLADEVQVLQTYFEHDLAREIIIAAIHDAQSVIAQQSNEATP